LTKSQPQKKKKKKNGNSKIQKWSDFGGFLITRNEMSGIKKENCQIFIFGLAKK
jgi:hypothetical protein